MRKTFRRSMIRRTDIDKVTWEKGAGAVIRLQDGTWVHLPDVDRGAQSLTNSIRAWVKHNEVE